MATYTMHLKTIIDHYTQFEPTLSNRERIEKGRLKLFNFPYPSFPEKLKKEFETNFIRHFYMSEIGFETEGLFKFQLENWLYENMPYWIKMVESDDLIKNPLINVDWTTTRSGNKEMKEKMKQDQKSKANQTGSESSNQNSKAKNSTLDLETDKPDSRLSITTNGDGTGVIEYASKIGENTVKGESSGTSSTTNQSNGQGETNLDSDLQRNENDYEVEHTKGTMGMKTEAEMLELYRKILMRFQKDMFKEMKILFMGVY